MLKKLGRLILALTILLGGIYVVTYFMEEYPSQDFGDENISSGATVDGTLTVEDSVDMEILEPTSQIVLTQAPMRLVELRQAIKNGIVTLEAIGDGLETLDLILESLTDEDLLVEVVPGTLFQPASAATQPMVVRQRYTLELSGRDKAEIEVQVGCASMHKGMPTADDSFSVDLELSVSDLIDLLD